MDLDLAALPQDVDALHRLIHGLVAEQKTALTHAQTESSGRG
jgi:hypothetical protein